MMPEHSIYFNTEEIHLLEDVVGKTLVTRVNAMNDINSYLDECVNRTGTVVRRFTANDFGIPTLERIQTRLGGVS